MATTPGTESSGKPYYGPAWDTEIEAVYQTPDGGFSSAVELFSRGQLNSRLNREPCGSRFIRRTHCGKTITKDRRGWAHCPICNQVFNCAYEDDDLPGRIEKASGYNPIVKETKAPPPRTHRKPKRAAR